MAKKYSQEDVLVSTEWVAAHISDPSVRVVESDEDVLLYNQGHVPGAVRIDWHNDLQDAVVRDYIGKPAFEKLCASKGISTDTTVVFYGEHGTARLLILSQVILSLQLSFAVVPLVKFTSDRRLMGEYANPLWLKTLAWTTAVVIAGLNALLLVQVAGIWRG